ncbi:Acyl-CoA--sterol O-acyltransferase 1 [Linum perenne]
MEGGEIEKFIKVWISILISLIYCYIIPNSIPKGPKRLVSIIPVVGLFLYLPLHLTSVHLGGVTAFFIAWLANFKLLLFSFGKGPLSNPMSLPLFIAVSCLPIKIQREEQRIPSAASRSRRDGPLNYTLKALSVAVLINVYDYSDRIHPKLILILYSLHIYFMLDLILAVSAAAARNLLGLELEPQFNEPYLSTSLQEFWGRRWNLSVTRILRPTVYDPIRRPSWEMTGFFLLHGACLVAEMAVKKAVVTEQRKLPKMVSRALTVGFVLGTGNWLFFPKFVDSKLDVKAFEEYAAVGDFFTYVGHWVVSFASR